MKFKQHPERKLRHLISAPVIYMMIVPSVFLDICLEIYHRIAFPLYGLQIVKRNNYILIDRQYLKKLSFMEKINCMYCGYVNGLMAYAVKIAGETEKYWCAIKHAQKMGFVVPEHQRDFVDYDEIKQ